MCADFLRRLLTSKNSPPLGYELDKRFCYDFTDVMATGVEVQQRGGLVYNPPFGWRRFALAGHNNNKLMEATRAIDSAYSAADDDWAVSYRGFHEDEMDASAKCPAGLTSTPDIETAAQFAIEDEWQGRRYKFVWQTLVNPRHLKTDVTDASGQNYWVAQTKKDIRRVAYCIRPL